MNLLNKKTYYIIYRGHNWSTNYIYIYIKRVTKFLQKEKSIESNYFLSKPNTKKDKAHHVGTCVPVFTIVFVYNRPKIIGPLQHWGVATAIQYLF